MSRVDIDRVPPGIVKVWASAIYDDGCCGRTTLYTKNKPGRISWEVTWYKRWRRLGLHVRVETRTLFQQFANMKSWLKCFHFRTRVGLRKTPDTRREFQSWVTKCYVDSVSRSGYFQETPRVSKLTWSCALYRKQMTCHDWEESRSSNWVWKALMVFMKKGIIFACYFCLTFN